MEKKPDSFIEFKTLSSTEKMKALGFRKVRGVWVPPAAPRCCRKHQRRGDTKGNCFAGTHEFPPKQTEA